jgi:hypothetical protein
MKGGRSSDFEGTSARAGIDIYTLRHAVKAAGGGSYALEGAETLLSKIRKIEACPGFDKLLGQLLNAKDPGDFRGRLLEINVAAQFLEKNITLAYGVCQDAPGDIDLNFNVDGRSVYLELKHLGIDQCSRVRMEEQIEKYGAYSIVQNNDLGDIVRLQRDLISKTSTKKFNPTPTDGAINLVGIDVSELQLGTVDHCDCLLAAGGNGLVRLHCHPACLRPPVVGIFEPIDSKDPSADRKRWVCDVHRIPPNTPHPREYIHGAVFLFRTPAETAALSYQVRSILVWNENLVSKEGANPINLIDPIEHKIREALPEASL